MNDNKKSVRATQRWLEDDIDPSAITVKQVRRNLFIQGGRGSGHHGHSGRPGLVGGSGKGTRTDWSQDESERIWQWTDMKGQPPIKSLETIAQEKPLAIEKQGDYTKWITGSIDEQTDPNRMQRSGTMFIRQDSTGFVTSAGFWMDYPEDFSMREFQRYSSLDTSSRAEEEMKRQKKHGFEQDFKVHFELAKKGKQGWWTNYG